MSDPPLHVEAVAFHLAERWHLQECPDASPAQAERWAARHWRKFLDQAFDFLALRAALAEKEGRGVHSPPPVD